MTNKYAPKPPAPLHTCKISRLSNSIHYGLEVVFILQDESGHGYRLIFHQHEVIIADLAFGTVRGAKIAFAKYCGYKAYTEEVKADWTHPYFPEKEWLDHILASRRKLQIEGKTSKDVLGDTQ